MFLHNKPGWGIALRIVLVLLLIGGMVWVTRAAFYRGVAAGAGNMAPGFMAFSGDDDMMDYHHQGDYQDFDGKSGEMFFHHPGTARPSHGFSGPMGHYSGYTSPMSYHSGSGYATGFFHLLFGILGFFFLVKLIFGFGGMGMYRQGPMGWGPGGRFYHPGHYRHHRCHCPECSDEGERRGHSRKSSRKQVQKESRLILDNFNRKRGPWRIPLPDHTLDTKKDTC